jgi:hypothetical protein
MLNHLIPESETGSYKSNYRTITTTIAPARLWSSWTSFHVLCTVSMRLFSVSSTNKADHRDITEVVLNMSLKDHNAKPLDSWKLNKRRSQ